MDDTYDLYEWVYGDGSVGTFTEVQWESLYENDVEDIINYVRYLEK